MEIGRRRVCRGAILEHIKVVDSIIIQSERISTFIFDKYLVLGCEISESYLHTNIADHISNEQFPIL